MIFSGKYAFQSTAAKGARKYLTSYAIDPPNDPYPVVGADQVSQTERVIVYQDGSGSLIFQTGDLGYFKANEDFSQVVEDLSLANATPMRCVEQNDGTFVLHILAKSVQQWKPISYRVNRELPAYLMFLPPDLMVGEGETLSRLTRHTVTPSLEAIQQSKNAAGQILDFRDVDLSHADLSGVNCAGADFTNAILDGANLSGATLTGATFVDCDLSAATFSQNASFGQKGRRGLFRRVTFDAGQFKDWSYLTLEDVTVRGTDLTGLRATETSAVDIPLWGRDLSGAVFRNADLTGADLTGADLTDAKLQDDTILYKAVFTGANLTRVEIDGLLGGKERTLAARFDSAYLQDAKIDANELFGVDFTAATLISCAFVSARTLVLVQASFENAYLDGVKFGNTPNFQGANFSNACLLNMDFRSADLGTALDGMIPARLNGAFLQGAHFEGAILPGANMTGAMVNLERGPVTTQYCKADGTLSLAYQGHYKPTSGLDDNTLAPDTYCPNGHTYAANGQQGLTLRQMLEPNPVKTAWVPAQCRTRARILQEAAAARSGRRR